MIEKENIRLLLVENLPDYAPESISQIHPIQRNSFHIQHMYRPTFLRWIPYDDDKGNSEIQKYNEILDANDIFIPEFIGSITAPGGVLGLWEWLRGTDLREANRHKIPHAFAMLGKYHKKKRKRSSLESDITREEYKSIPDLLDAEVEYLWTFSDDSMKNDCRRLLAVLENGFPTLNHGDVHPGNMVFSEGEIYFVDWGYSHFGLNFSDLSYLWDNNIYSDCPDGWWMIQGDEAENSIAAYLESIGLSKLPAREIMLAVMLRNQLYSYSNAIANGLEEEAIECENLLKNLAQAG